MDEKVPMTRKGYEKMQEELKQLKFVDRHEVIEAIEEACSHGDLSENRCHSRHTSPDTTPIRCRSYRKYPVR